MNWIICKEVKIYLYNEIVSTGFLSDEKEAHTWVLENGMPNADYELRTFITKLNA